MMMCRLSLVLALVHGGAPLAAQALTPDLVGEYSSNKVVETGVVGTPTPSGNPGSLTTPWSLFLNPAHPGVAAFFGVSGCPPVTSPLPPCPPGLDRQTFGETRGDQYLLGPWTGPAPVAAFDSGPPGPLDKQWLVEKDDGSGDWVYRRRCVTLPSGAYVTVFRPDGAGPDWGCTDYPRTALFYPQGYQGGSHEVKRLPAGWESADLTYDLSDTPFGYEIQGGPDPAYEPQDTTEVTYVRVGSIEYEALQMGMTLVFVQASLGGRPTFTHLAQMIEAARWLDSTGYETVGEQPVLHRKIITGGSYGGVVSMLSALYFPWVFSGALCRSNASDLHLNFAWGPVKEFYDDLLLGHYRDPMVDSSPHEQPFALEQMTSSRRGYIPDGEGIVPGIGTVNGVDLAGLGLLCDDLEDPPLNPPLYVPLLLIGGDEDPITYEFFAHDIQAINRPITCGMETYGGEVVVHRVPMQGHGTDDSLVFHRWNATKKLLHGFMAVQMAGRPCAPPSADCVTTQASTVFLGKPQWESKTPADSPQVSKRPREEFLKVGGIVEQTMIPGVSVSVLGEGGDTSAWRRMRSPAGLGLGQSTIVANVDADPTGSVELVAADAIGQLHKLRLVADANKPSMVRLDSVWSVRTSDYLGPTEILLDSSSTTAICLHKTGRVSTVPLDSDTAPATPNVKFELGYGISYGSSVPSSSRGSFFRSLRAVPGSPSAYSAVDDEGDLIRFSATISSATLQDDRFLEGGALPVLPMNSQIYVFASAHGNLKGYANVNNPAAVPALGPHVFTQCQVLLDIPPAGNVRFIGIGGVNGGHALILFRSDLTVQAYAHSSSSPLPRNWDGLVYAGESRGKVRLIGFSGGGNDSLVDSVIDAFEVDPETAVLTPVGPLTKPETAMPSPVTSVRPYPGALDARTPPDAEGNTTTFAVKWVATLETGQVALLGDLFLGNAVPTAILGLPLTSAFALRQFPSSTFALLLGPQKRSWSLAMHSDTQPITEQTAPAVLNASVHTVNSVLGKSVYPPVRGFVTTGGRCFGMGDGGDADGPLAACWVPSYVEEGREADRFSYSLGVYDSSKFMTSNVMWVRNAEWFSEPLVFEFSVGRADTIANILVAFGNSVKWADLDGDGKRDLVAGTYGGRVMWWKRQDTAPLLGPRTPTGTILADLGSSLIGLEAANLDDDPGSELLVGVGLRENIPLPHLFQTRGALVVADLVGNTLNPIALAVTEPGVVGIHHFSEDRTVASEGSTVLGDDDWIVVGTSLGRILVYHYDPARSPKLQLAYRSRFFAPMAGAYNSIQSFKKTSNPSIFVRRIVFATSGGVYGIDLTLPKNYLPGG